MKIGEINKGKDLPMLMKEGDLLSKGGKVHIVYDYKICRPSMIDGTERRREKLWEKVGKCIDYKIYSKKVENLGYCPCEDCVNRLEKEGYIQA